MVPLNFRKIAVTRGGWRIILEEVTGQEQKQKSLKSELVPFSGAIQGYGDLLGS